MPSPGDTARGSVFAHRVGTQRLLRNLFTFSNIMYVNYHSFAPSFFRPSAGVNDSDAENWNRLQNLFNLFQYFRIKLVTMNWFPSMAGGSNPVYDYFIGSGPSGLLSADQWLTYIKLVVDKSDTVTRDSTTELNNVLSVPGPFFSARTHKSISFVPEVQAPVTLTQGLSTNPSLFSNFTVDNEGNKWLPTHIQQADGSGPALNMDVSQFGVKVYYYNPFAQNVSTLASNWLGFWVYTLDFEFKDPEFRPLVPITSLVDADPNVRNNDTVSDPNSGSSSSSLVSSSLPTSSFSTSGTQSAGVDFIAPQLLDVTEPDETNIVIPLSKKQKI